MNEINLMGRLKHVEVPAICQVVMDIANEFSMNYCHRNDCQHVSTTLSVAAGLRDTSDGFVVEDLVQDPSKFSHLRYLLKQVLKSRGLKPKGMNPYDPNINSVEFEQYATADELVKRVALYKINFSDISQLTPSG